MLNDKKLSHEDGKIIAILSIVQGNGSKYFATNLSSYIKNASKKVQPRVVLIDFDFEAPYLAYEFVKDDQIHGVDNLINTINSDSLTKELFEDNLIKSPFGVDIIRGTYYIDNKRVFTRKIIETVLSFAKELYDYVIVVIGNKPNDAGMVYTLMNADEVVIVAKNDYSNMIKAPKFMESVETFCKKCSSFLVVHNYRNLNAKADLNAVISKENVKIIGVLNYDERTIDNINLGKKKGFMSKPMNDKEFTSITKAIVENRGTEAKKNKKEV